MQSLTRKKITPSDRANILSWIQNVLHHHLVQSMENLKYGTLNEM
jgi:hypothetical protein